MMNSVGHRLPGRVCWPLLLLGIQGLCACGEERAEVDVEVTGLTDAIRSLEIKATLGGDEVSGIVAPRLDRFVLKLGPGALGLLTVIAAGLEGDGCQVMQGTADLPIAGAGRFDLVIGLQPLPARACRVDLSKTENGGGVVVSDPPGITCGEGC